MKRIILTALIFCISVVFSNGALGDEVNDAAPSHICLKLGNRWVYKLSKVRRGGIFQGIEVHSIKSKEMLNDKEVSLYSVDNPEEGEMILYLTSDEQGGYLHKMIDSRGECAVLSSPLPLDRKNLQLGKKYTNSVPTKFYDADNKLKDKGVMKIEVELLGTEDIVVPAGNFKNCAKYSLIIIQQTKKNSIIVDQVRWYHKDIGYVKTQAFTKVKENNKEVYREYSELELQDSNKIKRAN